MEWFEIKNWLEASTGLARDALHIYSAIFVQLVSALLFRRSLAHILPWTMVFIAVMINEYLDYSYVPAALAANQGYLDGAIRDIWNTMLLPTIFLLIANLWPRLLTGSPSTTAIADTAGEPEQQQPD
ncbi:hypothetical protein [Parasphingorhabdus sp.]|uniref:hypothetical protein n=1 Tax=Parasphingorhabdus sp. TaxID=2709688 RepID=UPI003D28C8E0